MSEEIIKTNQYSLNPLLTNEMRFFIMSLLSMYEEVDFNFLKKELNATDGNLSIQLRKLEDSGYLTAKKEFVNRKPRTTYKITSLGLTDLKIYIEKISSFRNLFEKKK